MLPRPNPNRSLLKKLTNVGSEAISANKALPVDMTPTPANSSSWKRMDVKQLITSTKILTRYWKQVDETLLNFRRNQMRFFPISDAILAI